MSQPDDITLLREYADNGSQSAFAELAARHAGMVYAAAFRQVGDRAMAEDVAQAVFIILAQKARRLSHAIILPAWLWQVTRCAALSALRREKRIKARERRAIEMSSSNTTGESSWEQMSPVLDAALAKLAAKDRDAVILRFFKDRTFHEVGDALGVSEDAAKQRVFRAVAKLRKALSKNGALVSVAGLSACLSNNCVQAAPAQLQASLTASVTQTIPLTIAKGALTIMALAKAKSAALVALIVILLAGAGVVIAIKMQPRPVIAAASRPSTAPVSTWKDRFDAVYRLDDGEVVRRIAPPFIPERGNFLDTLDPERKFADDLAAYSFTWDNGIQSLAGPMKSITMRTMLDYILDVPVHRVELKPAQLQMHLSGDWIVRRGAGEREKLAALSAVLARDWQMTLTFEEQAVERDVIVARRAKPIQPAAPIHLFIRARKEKPGVVETDLASLLRSIARLADIPVIDETRQSSAPVQWTFGDISPDRLLNADEVDPLLKNISDQAGLTFTRERRQIQIWQAKSN